MYQSMAYAQKALYAPLLMAVLTMASLNAAAQTRNYGIIYSDNIRGGATIFGNTLMNIVNSDGSVNLTAMNGNSANGNSSYTNGNSNMQYVDVDGSTGDGAGTKNSSSSDLILPTGTNTIKMARLYWGGRTYTATDNMSLPSNRNIKIRKGTSGAYTQFGALQVDRSYQNENTATEVAFYQAYTDVTAFIQQNGAGTYTVGDATITKGDGGVFGNYGGWSIVIVYENNDVEYNSVRVYDGFQQVFNNSNPFTSSVTLTGLDVPSGALSSGDARMGVMTWEGDANFLQDFLEINGNKYSDPLNQIDNVWNGTISNDGVHVTTKNPNYTNQMGIDIDQFNVGTGYGILPNATSVTLSFGTEQDSYFPGVFSFVIKVKNPSINLTKTVTDANGNGTAEAGEVLTYKLRGENIGVGNANFVRVSDTLPANVTYVSGSLKIISGQPLGNLTDFPGDDNGEYINGSKSIQVRVGAGSNAVAGGTLALEGSFEVEFQVTINTPAQGERLLPVINIARMFGESDASVSYVDDGVAYINPDGGPLPVTLKSFTASLNGNSVKLNWATSMELNSKQYLIQRSTDGRMFTTVAVVDAAGNSSSEKAYSINDDVTAVTGAITYYRLNQVDLDGKSSYSKVISVRLKKGLSDFTVSPNPFRSYVNVNIDWSKNELTTVKVLNMTGRELVSKTVQMIKGTNYVQLDEVSKLPAGNYILQFNTGSERITKQLTKQ